ncbi:hypothetical protein BG006_004340 [Podila minutissima]|uniref:Beta-hexosaminidase n=1 Tax=Podila minutissima TaxID=64525 RepID=A0A9P5STB9_9FUNG|nr:hypothetical protein BG006_004340 [Podila minutissima]
MIKAVYSLSAAIAIASNAFLVSLLFLPDPVPVQGHLWPKPAQECRGHQTIQLANNFKFNLPEDPNPRLRLAATRFRKRILRSTFQSPVPVDPALAAKEDRSLVEVAQLTSVRVDIEDNDSSLGLDTDESYRILIGAVEDADAPFEISKGDCKSIASTVSSLHGVIRARTMFGALHGMETFSQLVTNSPHDTTVKEIRSTPIVIHDRPLFPHRGLLVDTSRNYLAMTSLYRTIDAMAMNKLNVFHWHITDSPSFPIELDDTTDKDQPVASLPRDEDEDAGSDSDIQTETVPGLPLSQLAAKGAYGPDMTYSKDNIRQLVEYAMGHGIRVIPELDMPGHAWSWSRAFPEITTCLDGYPSYSRFSAEPPSGQLNPVLAKTYRVLDAVYEQVLPLFPDGAFHSGADEVNFNCWNTTESITSHMDARGIPRTEAGFDKILDGFIAKQHARLRQGGKVPIVWEEPLLNHHSETLARNKDVIVQVWTSAKNTKKVISQGHRVITGSADYWYLDCGFGDWLGNWTMGNSWCDPYKSWQKIYSFNPLMGLSSKEAKSVLGGEALLWGEQVDDTNLDTKLWPRASAAAEVLWSGNSEDSDTKLWNGPDQEEDTLRNVEALTRINEHRFRMLSEKISAEPLQPLWCVQNPGHCLWPIYDSKPEKQAY